MKLGPYELNTIVTGDARELAKAIPDESVDLIFTDPVYQNTDDYRWLAETAARVLKQDRACLAWCSQLGQYKIKDVMSGQVDFVMPITYVVYGKSGRLMYYHTFTKATPLLWFQKGRALPNRWIIDSFVSMARPSGLHRWNKNTQVIEYYLTAFSDDDALVFDPFTGGGTVPAVCKMVGRNYLAFEIDPDTARMAREQVANTQPPLFVPQPEQERMALE